MSEMFSPGTYHGVVREITPSVTKQKQSPQMSIKVEVQFRANGSSWEAVDSAERWIHLSMSGRAAEYTMRKLDAIGFNGDFNDPKVSADAMSDNAGIDLICKHETYNGKPQERFELPFDDFEPTPLDATGIRQMNELWRQRNCGAATVAAKPKPRPSAPPSRPPPAPPAPEPDSGIADPVPF